MVGTMSFTQGWIENIFEDPDPSEVQARNAINEKIAIKRVMKVLLACWVVFRMFIEVAREENAGNLPENIKYDWLLFQILPLALVDDKDPFVALMNAALVGVSTDILQDLLLNITPTSVLGSAHDSENDSFFYVLDEAQVAGELYMGAFSDGGATTPRPVLRPIIRAWASTPIETVRFIVSGTGFLLSLFKTVLTSGVGKPSSAWHVVHTTGDFTDHFTQKSYISRYLPERFLSSPTGSNLVLRMHEWLCGRSVI